MLRVEPGCNENAVGSARALAVIVRQSPDWGNIDVEAYKEQSRKFCTMIGRPPDQMNELMDLWNSTFSVSYFQMRQAMKEIAETNLAVIQGAEIFHLESFDPAVNVSEQICCFIDDDDWFYPNILDELRAADENGIEGFRWIHSVVGGIMDGALTLRQPSEVVYTNNYAVKAKYLNAKKENFESVLQHYKADATFKSMRIKDMSKHLSVTNKHPASTIFLENGLKDQRTRANLAQLITLYCQKLATIDPANLPAQVSWIKPQLEQLQSFARKLQKSIK